MSSHPIPTKTLDHTHLTYAYELGTTNNFVQSDFIIGEDLEKDGDFRVVDCRNGELHFSILALAMGVADFAETGLKFAIGSNLSSSSQSMNYGIYKNFPSKNFQ